jgi:hypothetical protein
MNQEHEHPDEYAIVLKRSYPWVCLVDKTTKAIFYYNEENNTYTHDPPADFFKNDNEEDGDEEVS